MYVKLIVIQWIYFVIDVAKANDDSGDDVEGEPSLWAAAADEKDM